MRHRSLAAMSSMLLVGILVAGCTTKSYSCRGDACTVTVQGRQTLDDLGPGWDVQIREIGSGGLTLAVDGTEATVSAGQSAEVGPATVAVRRIAKGKATFEIRG